MISEKHIYTHFHQDIYTGYYPIGNNELPLEYRDGYKNDNDEIYHSHLTRNHRNLLTVIKIWKNIKYYYHDIFHTHYHTIWHSTDDNVKSEIHEHRDIFHCKGGKPFWYKSNSIHKHIGLGDQLRKDEVIDIKIPVNLKLGIFTSLIEKEYRNLHQPKIYNNTINNIRNHELNKFWNIWSIYKSVNDNLKKEMRNNILPHFENINWKTVYSIYDPNDLEFMELYARKLYTLAYIL